MAQEWVLHRVHPALRPYIATAVGYRQNGLAPGVHRGLPSPFLAFVVTLDEPLVLAAHADPRQAPGRYDGLIGGLHTRPALIEHPGRQAGIQLSLTPSGARALLGGPAGGLASVDAAVDEVLGAAGHELVERVRAADDWPARFAAVEQVLLARVRRDSEPAPEVAEAWRLTTRGGGRLRVADVAARVGWSERHLGERFRAETGLGPKEAARVVRFDRARRVLAAQAHLTREWRAFSGLSPTGWLRAELGFVQDRSAGGGQAAGHDHS